MTPRPTVQRVRLHRFRDALAVTISAVDSSGDPLDLPTVYLPASLAQQLGEVVAQFVKDQASYPFTRTGFGSRTLTDSGEPEDA